MRQRQTNDRGCSGSRRKGLRKRPGRPLHRVNEVMRRESVTVRSLAGRLNMTQGEAAKLVDAHNDLNLSELYRLAEVLGVPLAEMLTEVDIGLSEPVKVRAQLLRLMRTVQSIQENSTQEQVNRLATQLREELLKIMPELADVSSWPVVGNRRTLSDLGVIVDRCVPSSVFPAMPGEGLE